MPELTRTDGYDRVRAHASEQANARVDRILDASLARASENPDYALRRLGELEREWDIDRAILPVFAAMGAAAFALALRRDRRWRRPLAAQIGFTLLHTLIGWSPPTTVLRNLGFRTRQEIEIERDALSSMRRAEDKKVFERS